MSAAVGRDSTNFPSFSEGLSLRAAASEALATALIFPFLFGGTFIEGFRPGAAGRRLFYFPSFSEGLSLRGLPLLLGAAGSLFPFLFGGTFIEGEQRGKEDSALVAFPFLFGGTFIEGRRLRSSEVRRVRNFPSFSEGLSLRDDTNGDKRGNKGISLPFRRDFH